jgi:hypothetical protein
MAAAVIVRPINLSRIANILRKPGTLRVIDSTYDRIAGSLARIVAQEAARRAICRIK